MSDPRTPAEREQLSRSLDKKKPDELVVSTACPDCGTRFALLTRSMLVLDDPQPDLSGSQPKVGAHHENVLRCTECDWIGKGLLK